MFFDDRGDRDKEKLVSEVIRLVVEYFVLKDDKYFLWGGRFDELMMKNYNFLYMDVGFYWEGCGVCDI